MSELETGKCEGRGKRRKVCHDGYCRQCHRGDCMWEDCIDGTYSARVLLRLHPRDYVKSLYPDARI